MSDNGKGGVRSVSRAVRALELIAEQGELGVTDLGRGLGVHKATASRLAATLADGGLIERDPVSDRYPLEAPTPRTVTAPASLWRQLDEVRVRGYAAIQEELEQGLNAVAAPVRQLDGDVAAAVSVSGPSFRVRPVDLPRLGRLTIDAAGAVSRRLGYTARRAN